MHSYKNNLVIKIQGYFCNMSDLLKEREETMAFTHLHVHTEFSLLDGSNKIKEYVARVKELGMDSAAITDHGVMFGAIDFYKAAKILLHGKDSLLRHTRYGYDLSQ